MKPFLLLLAFLPAPTASAAEQLCVAPFDEGSRYELRFVVENGGVKGPAALRYVTSDGLDLEAEMKATLFHDDGNALSLTAASESMGVQLDVSGRAGAGRTGILAVSFSLDHAGALELEAECRP